MSLRSPQPIENPQVAASSALRRRISSTHALRAFGKLIRTEGSLSRDEIARIERKLALALPAA